jgi:hypothetical protein
VTMKALDVPSDPAGYMSGPTGNQTSRTNGGTNRSGGVSVVEPSEEVAATQTAEAAPVGESTPAPAPAPASACPKPSRGSRAQLDPPHRPR